MLVEVWFDLACPWCYVGKRRLAAALEGFDHRDEVTVAWRSFELAPGAPRVVEGGRVEHLARKYGTSVERARAMQEHMTRVAAGDGLELRLDRARLGSSFDAHRLVHLGAAHGRAGAAIERLFRAHLAEGEAIGDPDTLVRLGRDCGLPPDEVAELVSGQRFAAEVREDERRAAELGVTAVPFFAVDGGVGISGAHEPALLRKLLTRTRERSVGARAPEPQRPA